MTDVIYIVCRSQGEYSDRSEHVVCWFATEAEAQEHCVLCERACRAAAQKWKAYIEGKNYDYLPTDADRFNKKLPDPSFDVHSYGSEDVSFWVQEVPAGATPSPHPIRSGRAGS